MCGSGCFSDLQSSDGSTLETQIGLEVLGDFSHQTLEGQLADQQLSGLLVTTDLTQSHGTGPSQHINVKLSELLNVYYVNHI